MIEPFHYAAHCCNVLYMEQ